DGVAGDAGNEQHRQRSEQNEHSQLATRHVERRLARAVPFGVGRGTVHLASLAPRLENAQPYSEKRGTSGGSASPNGRPWPDGCWTILEPCTKPSDDEFEDSVWVRQQRSQNPARPGREQRYGKASVAGPSVL